MIRSLVCFRLSDMKIDHGSRAMLIFPIRNKPCQSFPSSIANSWRRFYSPLQCIHRLLQPSSSYISAEKAVLHPPWDFSSRSLNFISFGLAWLRTLASGLKAGFLINKTRSKPTTSPQFQAFWFLEDVLLPFSLTWWDHFLQPLARPTY